MDNIGSTSPLRPPPLHPLAPHHPSPPLFMSALSKLHGGATDAELQALPPHTHTSPTLPSAPSQSLQARDDKRRAFVEGLNSQVVSKHAAAADGGGGGRGRRLQNVLPCGS